MRSGRVTFLKIALALCGAAVSFLHAADSTQPSTPAAAPEKIEFSRGSSTSAKVPRPGVKTDDLLNRFGNVRETTPPPTDFQVPMAPQNAMPTRAATEKMLRELDKKKNWAVPTRQDDSDSLSPLSKKDEDTNDPLAEKPKGV